MTLSAWTTAAGHRLRRTRSTTRDLRLHRGIALAGVLTVGAAGAALPRRRHDPSVRADRPGTSALRDHRHGGPTTWTSPAGTSRRRRAPATRVRRRRPRVWTDEGDLSSRVGRLRGDGLPLSERALSMDYSKVADETGRRRGINLTCSRARVEGQPRVRAALRQVVDQQDDRRPARADPGHRRVRHARRDHRGLRDAGRTSGSGRRLPLGSGAVGDDVIHSITANCTTYTFGLAPDATAPVGTPTPTPTAPVKSSDDRAAALEGKGTVPAASSPAAPSPDRTGPRR